MVLILGMIVALAWVLWYARRVYRGFVPDKFQGDQARFVTGIRKLYLVGGLLAIPVGLGFISSRGGWPSTRLPTDPAVQILAERAIGCLILAFSAACLVSRHALRRIGSQLAEPNQSR
jgi:hypothetical protein